MFYAWLEYRKQRKLRQDKNDKLLILLNPKLYSMIFLIVFVLSILLPIFSIFTWREIMNRRGEVEFTPLYEFILLSIIFVLNLVLCILISFFNDKNTILY